MGTLPPTSLHSEKASAPALDIQAVDGVQSPVGAVKPMCSLASPVNLRCHKSTGLLAKGPLHFSKAHVSPTRPIPNAFDFTRARVSQKAERSWRQSTELI